MTTNSITLGSVLVLKGPTKGLGTGMKLGLEMALNGQKISGKAIKLEFLDDSYEPETTKESVNELVKKDVFLFIGNVGTPTSKVALPILAKNNIPAFGFFTGAGILRPGVGQILNYRASYIQETEKVILTALKNGLKPDQVCAYVQNDSFGMAGLSGVLKALKENGGGSASLEAIEKIIKMEGDEPLRNNIGPVGVYKRNTIDWKDGYDSLVKWEKNQGKECKLIVTVGAYENVASFIKNTHRGEFKKEWVYSAVSFTGADEFKNRLKKYRATDRVIMTQVVPLLDSDLPIVKEAKGKLGLNFGLIGLEGFIVGKLFLEIAKNVKGTFNRENFLATAYKTKLNLGGIKIDFTKDKNQGSNLVIPSKLSKKGWVEITDSDWKSYFNTK